MNPKEIVKGFYTSDFFNENDNVTKYLHPDMQLYWNARTGYEQMDRDQVIAVTKESAKSFETVRCAITHLLAEGNEVTIRFTFYVSTIENPNEETPLAHFIAIWEIKDGQMYRGYQISQPVEEAPDAMQSYLINNS